MYIFLLLIPLIIEFVFKPRIDYFTTENEKWIILWYGKTKRNYIKLIKY